MFGGLQKLLPRIVQLRPYLYVPKNGEGWREGGWDRRFETSTRIGPLEATSLYVGEEIEALTQTRLLKALSLVAWGELKVPNRTKPINTISLHA